MKTAPIALARITKWDEILCHASWPVAFISHSLDYSGSTAQHIRSLLPQWRNSLPTIIVYGDCCALHTSMLCIYYAHGVPAGKTKGSAPRCAHSRCGGVCQQTRVCLAAITHKHRTYAQSDWALKWETCSLHLFINNRHTQYTHTHTSLAYMNDCK